MPNTKIICVLLKRLNKIYNPNRSNNNRRLIQYSISVIAQIFNKLKHNLKENYLKLINLIYKIF